MSDSEGKKGIPEKTALKLCEEIRKGKNVRIFSQCWGCMKYSKGNPARMCFYDGKDNRGCKKVNDMLDRHVHGK
jgi:hypothetical protein